MSEIDKPVKEAIAVFKRARELIIETADAGDNQTELFAFALLFAQFERTRKAGEAAAADPMFKELAEIMKVKLTHPVPGELPPIPLISLMKSQLRLWCERDIAFAIQLLIPVIDLIKEGYGEDKHPRF